MMEININNTYNEDQLALLYFDFNNPNMENGQVVLGSLYIYAPNKGAPIFFTIAFAVSAVGHIWQCFRYRSWKVIGLHPLCAVLFTVGYALREVGSYHYIYNSQTLGIYIGSQVCIFICPPLLELANYHVLGRIFHYVPYYAPLPADKVLTTFGGLMGIVEALNSLGVAFTSNPKGSQQGLGKVLTLVALGIQLCVIMIFVVMASVFHRRCSKANIRDKAIPTLVYILYISMLLILIRCIYRIVQHVGNSSMHLNDPQELRSLSPLLRYEWYFYVFEASLMLVNSFLWNVWNPGRYLPRNANVCLTQYGRTEIAEEVQEIPDDRPALAKAGHTAMQILTWGLWGRISRPKNKEELPSVDSDEHELAAFQA